MMDKDPITFEAHENYVLDVLFTSDGETLISSGMDNLIKLWSVPDWQLKGVFEGHAHSANSIALSPDEKTLASGSSDQTLKLWSFPEGRELHTLQDRKKTVPAVAFSHNGRWVAAGSYGGRAVVWNLSGEQVVGIKANPKNLSSIAFSPDDKILATTGLGAEIKLWSLPDGEQITELSGHEIAAWSLRFIKGGGQLVSLGYEQTIKFWDTKTWTEIHSIDTKAYGVKGLKFSPDEQRAVTSAEGKLHLWSTDTWKVEYEIVAGAKALYGMDFSPDGKWLAVGAADKKIRVWELALFNAAK